MYAQLTTIHVPLNRMADLQKVIETKYLPVIRSRPGFLAAYLMEQTDDPDTAQLVQFWDSHAAVENFNRTGLLQASVGALAADIPGIQIKRDGYIVRVAMRATPELQPVG